MQKKIENGRTTQMLTTMAAMGEVNAGYKQEFATEVT